MANAEGTPVPKKVKDKDKIKKLQSLLGTSKVIKLPFIIGTEEYKKHPFAGVVYLGEADADEQEDLYMEEQERLKQDAEYEQRLIEQNQRDMALVDQYVDQ